MSETGNVSRGDSVAVIGRGGVGAAGADVVVDAVGRPETWAQAFTTMHAGGVLRFVVVL